MSNAIQSVLVENRVFPPPASAVQGAAISGMDAYWALCEEADKDFNGFWSRLARENLQWSKPFTQVLDESEAPFYRWFGDGELNATILVLDNEAGRASTLHTDTDGLFNDGYGVHLSYKTTIGDVTIEPQIVTVLTETDIWNQDDVALEAEDFRLASKVTPWTLGATASMPVGDELKLTGSAFYTFCDDGDADYHATLLRLKGEYGPFMAWVDYNPAEDKKAGTEYSNTFVWAQYKYNVYESAAGSFTLQPTLRWLTTAEDGNDAEKDTSTLRAELWATVSF